MLVERENTLKTAEKLLTDVICQQEIKSIKKDFIVNEYLTRFCYLHANGMVVCGIGKGCDLAEIDMSACYEALEYYLSGYCFYRYAIVQGTPENISTKYALLLNRCHPEKFLFKAKEYFHIPWVIYEDIKTHKQYAVPLASVDLSYQTSPLANDLFNYASCNFFAASNGLASGSTYEESVIHGILEALERDAYSYLLIDLFILKKSPLIINKNSLPNDLILLINKFENDYQMEIIILQMPSRFGVYVYMATFLEQSFEIRPQGCGASLDASHALERAILELIQIYNLMYGSFLENEIDIVKMENNNLIKNILEFDINKLIENKQYIKIDFPDVANIPKQNSLSEYLAKLIALIYACDSSVLINIIYQNDAGLTCSRVIMPDAEEFFLATHYLKLLPKPKTYLYIASQLGKKFNWEDFVISKL